MGTAYVATQDTPLPDGAMLAAMAALNGMAFLCIFELVVLALTTLRRKTDLYFWSMIIAITGALLFNLGVLLYCFALNNRLVWLSGGMFGIGYLLHVPAELLVLYSRLHLLGASPRTLKLVIMVIVLEVLLMTAPIAILSTGAVVVSSNQLNLVYSVWQRIEVWAYAGTEIFLSSVYIVQVRRMWKADGQWKMKSRLMSLVYIYFFIILLDVSNIGIEFSGYTGLQGVFVVSQPTDSTSQYFTTTKHSSFRGSSMLLS
jgi:hypothetical protein